MKVCERDTFLNELKMYDYTKGVPFLSKWYTKESPRPLNTL